MFGEKSGIFGEKSGFLVTYFDHMSCVRSNAFRNSFKLQNPQSHTESRKDNLQHPDEGCQRRKMAETFGAQ